MRRPLLFLCVLLFAFIALGMQVLKPPPWESKTLLRGEEVLLSGQVYDKEYREYENGQVLILFLQSVTSQNSDFNSKEKIRCEISLHALPSLEDGKVYLPCLGTVITVRGRWQEFAQATNPGEFDMARYYGIEGIVGDVAEAELLGAGTSYWWLREMLFRCKWMWTRNLYEAFPPKEASILAKMLLGEGGVDAVIRDLYQSAGIAHILSISGLHISMIGMGIFYLLRKCGMGLKSAALLGATVIIFYGMLTGFGVSACRAIGMYLIHMLGEIWGKTYDMLTAMGVLGVLMLVRNPRLVYHSGYLLSFSSVCGVGLLAPLLQANPFFLQPRPYEKKRIRWLKMFLKKGWSGLAISLSVTLFTFPIQLYFFYKVPVYSVFLNLLVIPFVSIVMVLGFLIMFFPMLFILCPVETGIFVWFEWLCTLFRKIPGHTWLTGKPDMWKLLVYYVLLLCLILGAKTIRKRYCYVGFVVLVLFVGIRWNRVSQITFLDVGQGDCAVVQTRVGQCFLFDCGSSSKSNIGDKILIPFLQHQGIGRLDGIFLSHADADHINGVIQMLQSGEVKVGMIFLPDYKGAEEDFEKVIAYVSEEQVSYVSLGMQMKEGDVSFTCLHPEKEFYAIEDNEVSACYLLQLEGRCVLFTGDVSKEREKVLLEAWRRQGGKSVDVLKVAHHGSRFSTSSEFLEVIHPGVAVISCGRNNLYGHPHVEVLGRLEEVGSEVHITAKQGAVILTWKKARW